MLFLSRVLFGDGLFCHYHRIIRHHYFIMHLLYLHCIRHTYTLTLLFHTYVTYLSHLVSGKEGNYHYHCSYINIKVGFFSCLCFFFFRSGLGGRLGDRLGTSGAGFFGVFRMFFAGKLHIYLVHGHVFRSVYLPIDHSIHCKELSASGYSISALCGKWRMVLRCKRPTRLTFGKGLTSFSRGGEVARGADVPTFRSQSLSYGLWPHPHQKMKNRRMVNSRLNSRQESI